MMSIKYCHFAVFKLYNIYRWKFRRIINHFLYFVTLYVRLSYKNILKIYGLNLTFIFILFKCFNNFAPRSFTLIKY